MPPPDVEPTSDVAPTSDVEPVETPSGDNQPVTDYPHLPALHVLVGLPGAGKTTRARELEREHRALRLTPDEWMVPLFGEPEADGARDVLEGRFIWLAMRALRAGVDVVLDFGVWSRDERTALRALAREADARCHLVYLPVEPAAQAHRVEARLTATPDATFAMTRDDLARWRRAFTEPTPDELDNGPLDPPPAGYSTWAAWSAERWPTSGDEPG